MNVQRGGQRRQRRGVFARQRAIQLARASAERGQGIGQRQAVAVVATRAQAHFAAQPGAQAAQGFRPLLGHPVQAGVVQRQAVCAQRRRLAQGVQPVGGPLGAHRQAQGGAQAQCVQQAQAAAQFVGVGRVGVQTQAHAALPPAGKRLRRQPHRHFLRGGFQPGRGVAVRQQGARRAQRIAQTHPGQAQRIQRRQPRRLHAGRRLGQADVQHPQGRHRRRAGGLAALVVAQLKPPPQALRQHAQALGLRQRQAAALAPFVNRPARHRLSRKMFGQQGGQAGHAAKVGDQLFDGKRHEGWLLVKMSNFYVNKRGEIQIYWIFTSRLRLTRHLGNHPVRINPQK